MEKWTNNCSVCLNGGPNLLSVTQVTTGDNLLLSLLRACVPEIDWKDTYVICETCRDDLVVVSAFRQRCLTAETVRSRNLSDLEPQKAAFSCSVCDEGFGTSCQVIAHCKKQHNLQNYKPFPCHLCPHRFHTSYSRFQHLKYHNGERAHVCSYCGKAFVTMTDLVVHEKIHLNKREYKCEECLKSFNTHKHLRSHKLVVHTDPELWSHVCDFCSKRFPIKSNLDAHIRRHKNERPFACHLCNKRFIDKSVLQKHFLTHSNCKAFVCDVCNKEYKQERVMQIHKKKVHGIGDIKVPERVKKFLCHLCAKLYFDKNKLRRHMAIHKGALCQGRPLD